LIWPAPFLEASHTCTKIFMSSLIGSYGNSICIFLIAVFTTSSTLRSWPRWITSTPVDWIILRIMLIAASWPSKELQR
jgi:hypothetical protein